MNLGFKGQYGHSMDKKRRVSVPAKMRNKLGERVVVTKEVDRCLIVYPIEQWEEKIAHLQNMTTTKREARATARFKIAGAAELEIDKLGRVLLPQYLTEFAGIKKDVKILGLGNRIEFWDEKKWEVYNKKIEKEMPDLVEKLEASGV